MRTDRVVVLAPFQGQIFRVSDAVEEMLIQKGQFNLPPGYDSTITQKWQFITFKGPQYDI